MQPTFPHKKNIYINMQIFPFNKLASTMNATISNTEGVYFTHLGLLNSLFH